MSWLFMLHISSLLCWCAALLYLPLYIGGFSSVDLAEHRKIPFLRRFFTILLTPLGMLTIISGTLIFIFQGATPKWLVIKLTLVAGLVLCHVLNGWLILRLKNGIFRSTAVYSFYLNMASVTIMLLIFAFVLAKPLF